MFGCRKPFFHFKFMDTFKKLSKEIGDELNNRLLVKEAIDLISKTKDAGADSGTFEVIISTDDEDRHGEVVAVDSWNFNNYMKNPIVLFGHDYYSLPIGICDSITQEGNKIIAKGRFAPMDANPFAQQCRKLYDLGILKATSVGFIAEEIQGNVITKAQLLEFSFVPVPANPYALSLRQVKELGIDSNMLRAKGIDIKEVEEVAPTEEVKPIEEVTPVEEPKVEEPKIEVAPVVEDPKVEAPKVEEEKPKETEPVTEAKSFLTEKAVEQINFTISLLKSEIATLQNILATAKVEAGVKEVDAGKSAETKGLDEWLFVQNILKAVNNASSSALAKVNAKCKEIL